MRKSFAQVPSPMLASVVKERTPAAAIAAIRNSEYHGATGIDLHLSCLDESFRNAEDIRRIIDAARLPILVLHYNIAGEGPALSESDDMRMALLLQGIEAGAAALDMQGYTFDPVAKAEFRSDYAALPHSFLKKCPKEVVMDPAVIAKQTALIDQVHALGAEVLLSNHIGVSMSAEELTELALFLEQRNPDIIKIVSIADTEEEAAEAFRAMVMLHKEVKTPVSYHCSGRCGAITRIVNPMLGGFMAFCNDGFTAASDLNQPNLETVKAAFDNIKKIIF